MEIPPRVWRARPRRSRGPRIHWVESSDGSQDAIVAAAAEPGAARRCTVRASWPVADNDITAVAVEPMAATLERVRGQRHPPSLDRPTDGLPVDLGTTRPALGEGGQSTLQVGGVGAGGDCDESGLATRGAGQQLRGVAVRSGDDRHAVTKLRAAGVQSECSIGKGRLSSATSTSLRPSANSVRAADDGAESVKTCSGVDTAPTTAAADGGSPITTWVLAPQMPNALTPARRGRAPGAHGERARTSSTGIAFHSMWGDRVSQWSWAGSSACCSASVTLSTPAKPAAASR